MNKIAVNVSFLLLEIFSLLVLVQTAACIRETELKRRMETGPDVDLVLARIWSSSEALPSWEVNIWESIKGPLLNLNRCPPHSYYFSARFHLLKALVWVDSNNNPSLSSSDLYPCLRFATYPAEQKNYIFSSYFHSPEVTDDDDGHIQQMTKFARETTKFLNAIFVMFNSKGFQLFTRGRRSEVLVPMQVLGDESATDLDDSRLEALKPPSLYQNFQSSVTVTATVCLICGSAVEHYHETGSWIDLFTATLYELTQRFNTSLVLMPVFGLPRHQDSLQELDAYTEPLIDGSATITSILKPTLFISDLVLITNPVIFDSIQFIFSLPKRKGLNPILAMVYSFQPSVWALILASTIGLFLSLELILQAQQKFDNDSSDFSKGGSGKHFQAFGAIMKPMLDQVVTTSKILKSNGTNSIVIRFLAGVWLLVLIVLSCAYKSKMIELIAMPQFSTPPTNFQELAESDYKIGAVCYSGMIEDELLAVNTTSIHKIVARVQEFNLFDSTCYENIVTTKAVCIGYHAVFQAAALNYLVSVKKRRMYQQSHDSKFSSFGTMAINLDFPELLEPLNYISQQFDSSGLRIVWSRAGEYIQLRKGQEHALKERESKPYYDDDLQEDRDPDDDEAHESRLFMLLLLQIIAIGIGLGTLVIAIEVGLKFREGMKIKGDLIRVLSSVIMVQQ